VIAATLLPLTRRSRLARTPGDQRWTGPGPGAHRPRRRLWSNVPA